MSEKTLRACLYFLGAVTVLYFVITLAGGGGGGASAGNSGLAAAFESIDGAGAHPRRPDRPSRDDPPGEGG